MLSKKDFVATAKIIKTERETVRNTTTKLGEDCIMYTLATLADVARQFADHFAAANPRFDRRRFLEACGVRDV